MKKTSKALLCLSLILVFTAAGCSENGGQVGNNTADSTSAEASVQTQAPGSSEPDYGTIKTVDAPDSFTGNTGEVKIESGDTYAVIKIRGYEGDIKVKLFPEAAPEGVRNFIDTANSGYYSGKEIHRVMADFMLQGGSENGDGRSTEDDPEFYVEYNSKMRHFYGALCYANGGGINGRQFYIVNNKTYTPITKDNFESNIEFADMYITQLNELLKDASGEEKQIYEANLDYFQSVKAGAYSGLRALDEVTEEITAKYKEVGGTPYLDGGYTVFGQTVEGFEVIDEVSKTEVEKQPAGDEVSHPVQKIVIESVTVHTAE